MKPIYFCFLLITFAQNLLGQYSEISKNPNSQDCIIYLNTGDSLFKIEKYIQAREFYYKAYYCDSTNIIDQKIKLCYKEAVENIIICGSSEIDKITEKADSAFMSKNFQKAKELYFRAVYLKPLDSTNVNKLKKCFRKTVLDSSYFTSYDTLIKIADFYFSIDRYKEAETYYREAMIKLPMAFYPEGMVAIIEKLKLFAK